jgi:methionine-rich copper-binding protein CopC
VHDDACGYAPADPGAACGFACRICPIEELIGGLPSSVSASTREQVQAQLDEICALYDGLTAAEQRQVDLSRCEALQERINELGTVGIVDEPPAISSSVSSETMTKDDSITKPRVISYPFLLNTAGFTLTNTAANATAASAIRVTGTGELYLLGIVTSQKGAGVEVQSGGFLNVTGENTVITGKTYALDIAAGARVELAAGTYTGGAAAINLAEGDFAALLAPGCAFYDENGSAILAENAGTAKTLVVRQCTDHANKTYTANAGTITHTWTCQVCKATGTEQCTFTFDENGKGTCGLCGNEVTIEVDRDSLKELAYDTSNSGNVQPENGTVIVTAKNGTTLTQGTDYTVEYSVHADVGNTSVTVTVTVVMGTDTDNGTFTKGYTFTKDELTRPVLEWDTAGPVTVSYDGAPVEASELPPVTIHINSNVDLHQYLQYSYKVQGDTAYTDGLPTNAGTYDVVVSLPERPEVPDLEAASSEPITLIIEKINPLTTAPEAAMPTFNGADQELVTAGTLDPAAAGDGAKILFATAENGPYSEDIPVGVNAGTNYTVWYKVDVPAACAGNYNAVGPTQISGVEIKRKPLTPVVSLSSYKYQYDGEWKTPEVTVKDGDDMFTLPDTEYAVEYVNNRNVSTDDDPAKVVVTDKPDGNYEIQTVTVKFQITSREQETLSITNKPGTVAYGDEFTLSTLGGSGNGDVTWEVVADSANDGSATINTTSGRVKITGAGTITVKATKSGVDPETNIRNYDDATAAWTFVADKKAVVATVTAEDKEYNGNNIATIHAVVEEGVLPGDEITIAGLEGAFSDENAGVDKKVTVDPSKVTISGKNSQHYEVSYSSLSVTATIRKAIATIKNAPDAANLTYDGNAQALIDAANLLVDPSGIQVEYALSREGPYSITIPEETNAGTYTVWYRVQETQNYTGLAPAKVDVTIAKKTVNPVITLSGDGLSTDSASASPMQYYIYDGTAKEPVVTLEDENGNPIPADEYTVSYSDNTNVGTATVTVTAKDGGNYSFSGAVTKNFRIDRKKATVVTAPNMAGDPLTYTGRAQQLVTEGTGSGGTMFYALEAADGTKTFSETIPTAINAGDYTVYYKVKGDDNHSDSDEGQVKVTIAPKTVKDPTIELLDENGAPLVSYTYDGSAKKPTVVVKDGSTVIGKPDDVTGENDEYNVIYTNNVDAGTATVNITDKTGGNYTVTGSATFVIVKADIKFNPEPEAANITYDGKAHELVTPGTTSGGTVQYALNSPNTTFSDAIPQATAAGNYTVYYKVIGDKNHNDLAVKSVPVTIARKELTAITIELAPESFVYDGQAHLPEITVKDGKTVLPEEEYTWKCTQSDGTEIAAPTSQGTYTITIEDAPNGNYDLSRVAANTKTFTIGRAAQAELVIGGKPSATNYGDTFTLSTTGGSSSSAVTWSVTGTAATVNASTGAVKITGVGEVTITATNPGDQNYESVSAQWSFTAAPKPVTASVTVADRAYDGTTDATVASAGIDIADLVNSGDTVTIDETSITAEFDTASVGTGKTVTLDTSKVKVSGTDAAKYAISYPSTVTADITQATTSITTVPVKIDPLTYTGQPQKLVTAGKSNVGFIVYSLDGTNFSPEIPTGTDAGTYEVYYKVAGTADYTEVSVNTTAIEVTIAPKTVTNPVIEPEESSYLYDGAKHEPKITVKDGKTVIDEDQYTITWANDDTAITDDILTAAGSYTATIESVSGGNYSFTAKATVEIVPASQAALNITGQPEHVCYGDKITTLSTSGGSGNGTLTWSIENADASAKSTINPSTGELTVKDTGSITVKAERTVPNYGTVSDTWTFTVEPKPVTAVVTVAAKDYNGTTDIANGAITAVVKNSDLVDPANDSITISGLEGAYTNANAGKDKTVTLDASKATTTADTNKYTVSYPATAKADINPREVDVTVTLSGNDLDTDNTTTPPTYSYEYDGTEKTPTVTVTGTDAGGYTATLAASDYTFAYANNKNVGTASVTVECAEGGNYTFTSQSVTFEIKSTAAKLTSTPQAKRLTYDGTLQDLVTVGTATGGTVVYSLSQINPKDPKTYSENIPQGQNAGVYTVYYMVKGDANHEDTASGQVSVTIDPKEITPKITLNTSGPFEYSGSAHEPTITVEDGAVTIPANEYTVSYRDNINAGTATVIVSNKNGGNYIVNGTAEFTITKAAPTVTDPTANPGLKYTGALQDLVTAGVTSHGTVVYSVNGGNYSAAVPAASAVGQYTIDYKVLGDGNHSDTAPATLNVSIAKNRVNTPTISLSADTFKYNGSQRKPTIIVYDDSGAVIPEREYVVTITGVKSNNMVDVDTYTVTITTPSTSNYVITNDGTSNTRTFEIVPADQETISITGTQAKVSYGDTIQLGTTGGTGSGTVTWEVTGGTDSDITAGGLLTVKDVGGPITVTAKRSMGNNYGDVSATWEFSPTKKAVTAVVTAADRNYIAGDTTATVTATVPGSELVSGDSIIITGLTGTFDDASAGTNKKVTIDSSSASVSGTNWENYDITYPITTTASILAAAATVDTDPQAKTLTYDASQSQELVTAGTATGGTMVYSLDGTNFTPAIPKAKDAGDYTVYFKAKGDGNHTDSAVGTVTVTIDKQTVTPTIELNPPTAPYDGKVKRPEVTVLDNANNVIPASEYKATYVTDGGKNWTDQGTYDVKVENITGGNYIVTTATADFTISTTAQNPLEIVNKPGLVYYGDTFTLSATGGSGSGAVTWSVDSAGASVVKIDGNGLVEIIGKGKATITATRPGGGNYDDATATYSLNALAKPITAIVTAEDRVYASGNTNATIHVTWKDGDLVGNDVLDTSNLTGAFRDDSVGTNKTVTIKGTVVDNATAQKYDITIPATTTASILKAGADAPNVAAVSGLVYTGNAQDLVTGGNAGTTLYSDSWDGVYSANVPTGTNAGTYTVWYKAKGDANHNDSEPQSVTVTISRKTLTVDDTNATLSGSDLQTDANGTYYYEYDGTEKKPSVIITDGGATVPASEYTVSYRDNKNVSTASKKAAVTITNAEGGNYDVSGNVTFEIREGTATLTGSPQAKDLTYTGQKQELVTVGTASGGHIEYMLLDKDGNGTYGTTIPTATDAGTYTVTYKVVGDSNHSDSATTGSVTVTIKPKEIISPVVTVSGTYTYDGNPQEPGADNITVKDGTTTIKASEYSVTYRDNTDAGTATVVITNANGGNYIVNGTGTFTIGKAELAAADITAPEGIENLPYYGTAQALVKAGNATGGTMVYSLSKAGDYSPAIPTGTAVKEYTVWYKVLGDENHNDTELDSVTASIITNTVSKPTIQVEPATVKYTGEKQEPTITVKDDNGLVIDGSEYTVAYTNAAGTAVTDLTNVGKYTVTITGVSDGNYTFDTTDGKNTATFEILAADQEALTITGTRERVYYGDTIQLGTTGGNGTVAWTVNNDASTIATISNDGLLKITGVGSVTVTATSSASGYTDQTATWRLYADPKPVTAVVTAQSKDYDTTKTATVTAALQASDLVGSDVIKITLSGEFEDPNAGTDKKVIVNSSSPNFDGSSGTPGNYNITYPATTTASILKANIDTANDVTAPTAADAADLVYTGNPLALVKAGAVTGGTMEYSTDGINFSASLPTSTNAGDYDVWYRVKGDGNHNDIAAKKLDGKVTISKQTVTSPTIEFTPSGASYDGQEHKPTVTVKDANGRIIPDTEYTVDYGSTNWKDAGDHKVNVTAKGDGNYVFDVTEGTFTILPAGQNPLTIVGQPGRVQYGDVFTLSTLGGSGTGGVIWETSNTAVISLNNQTGQVQVLKSGGPVTITARKQAGGGYSETTATWTFSAEKKAVTPIVTAKDKVYDNNDTAELVITWKDGDLLNGDTITLNLTGTFDDANVGAGKTVRITGTAPSSDKYDITIPATTRASITPKTASVTGVTAILNLVYDRTAKALVNEGTATGGTVVYSLDGVNYTPNVPTGTNAGAYTVWYKVEADTSGNYKDSTPARVVVNIAQKTVTSPTIELDPDTFEYDGTAKKPDVTVKDGSNIIPASEYTVSYSNNTAVGTTAKVTISDAPGGNYIVSGTKTFTITAGKPAVIDEPQPRNLTYNGREQTLVTRGTAANGHMEYSFGEYDDYGTSLPKATDAGVYEVWYKVVGDDGTETIPELVIAEILPKTVNPTVTLNLTSDPLPYTGRPLKPLVTVAVGSATLNEHTDYTLTYSNNTNPGTATVAIQSVSESNYQFYTTRTFEIAKAKAEFAVAPEAIDGLVYNGEAQELFEAGISLHGIVLYSKDTVTYTADIPTGTNVGNYTFFAKVRGNATHEDSDPIIIQAAIGRNEPKAPTVVLTGGNSFSYTGGEIKPTVTVYDDSNKVIPATEYTVSYSNNTNVGKNATVTVTGNGKNYSFTATATFEIVSAGQTPLEITGKKDAVYYGDTLSLSATGGSGSSVVTWTVEAGSDVVNGSDGHYKIIKSGMVTIKATKAASTGYEAVSDTWTFLASPKPVEAIVTAADKDYDGKTDATLNVTLSGLVKGDNVSTNTDGGVKATGHFMDAKVGADKTVVIELTIPDAVSEKYDISYPATTKASITQAAPTVDTQPEVATNLTYNGAEQALLANEGSATGGNIMYSLDGGVTYSYTAPKAKDAGAYDVWYKVVASDTNYRDTAPAKAGTVTIEPNKGTPTASCSPNTLQYNGAAQTPAVDVLDRTGRPIPAEEYTVTVVDGPAINPGTYQVSVTDKTGGNYEFSDTLTAEFEIVTVSQNPLSITDKPASVHYGDKFVLSAIGGSGSGEIVWSIAGDSSIATVKDGVVTVTGTGPFTVEAYREASGGYGQSNTDTVTFYADPKPITPVVTAANKSYDGTTTAALTAKFKDGDLVGNDQIALIVGTGTFETPDVGTNKKVSIVPGTPNGTTGNYVITWPESTTANISRVNAQWEQEPTGAENLAYTGNPQALIATGTGTTKDSIGKVEYSTSQYSGYSTEIPTGTKAGTYTVWYRVADDVNYQGLTAESITVEIKRADPGITSIPTANSGTRGQTLDEIGFNNGGSAGVGGKFAWKDGTIQPEVGTTEQTVIFTPNDTDNYEEVEFQIPVTVTDPSGTPSTPGGSTGTPSTPPVTPGGDPSTVQTTVQNGTASTVVSAAAGSRLVQEAVENQSDSIVIKPEITGSVTRNEVTLPASTVSQIRSQTSAALTVSAPIADVTIPNAGLDTLGSAGGSVSVATEQVEQAVVLTVTANGETVNSIPGGVTLTVPAEDAGPGTVAVLVHEDGTRETVQKSMVEDGKISIPLAGSGTVEIVDNSKAFDDVQPTAWEADAVAFASARELFSGTSETTFSPTQPMSRGMLATVLYRLEGSPDQDAPASYGDVSSDAWYADGVAWATENGIANGYGDGQFGPNNNVTREQFAVMLWNYAGRPSASGQTLDFTDADQASGYALEALCWAVENGILNGYGNGKLIPGGMATRAQAAQMLKNFMENT